MTRATSTIKKLLAVTGATLVLATGAAVLHGRSAHAQAANGDCSTNSIIRCGVSGPADFIAKAKANNPADLQNIYTNFSLPTSQYDAFATGAKMGVAKQNGDIVYNNQVVARDAWSIGRTRFSYSQPYTVNGQTYYKSANRDVLNQDNMPAMLWFDQNNRLTAAILTQCGNPMGGTVTTMTPAAQPSYSCNQLNRTQVDGQANTYSFTTNAPVASGATISRVVYDFGDGTAAVTRTTATEAVTHTYATAGTYTAKVTVYFRLPDGREVSASGAGCATSITVQQVQPQQTPINASAQCTALTAARKAGADYLTYTFTANNTLNNARIVGADFDFGDGTAAATVTPTDVAATMVSADHAYATAGTYTAKATIRYAAVNTTVPSTTTPTTTTPTTTTTGTTTPTVTTPATSNSVCQTTIAIAAPVTPAATTPTLILPKTGPAGVAGLFAGTSALGAIGYRIRASRKLHKVDQVVDRLLKR